MAEVETIRVRRRRGSYFFVIDAFIGASIIILTLLMLFKLYIGLRPTEQPYNYAADYMGFLTNTEIRDYDDPVIAQMITDGWINDSRHTLAEQLLLFQNLSNVSGATLLLKATSDILPSSLALNVTIQNGSNASVASPILLFNKSLTDVDTKRTHFVVKQVEYVYFEKTNFIGPKVLIVEVWS